MANNTVTSGKLAEVAGPPVTLPISIFKLIEVGLRSNPDAFAIISMPQPADHLRDMVKDESGDELRSEGTKTHNCLHWTYRELHRAAMRLVAGLLAHGVQPGMRIATLIPNRVEFHLILWACQVLRLTLCSLDPGATNAPRQEELSKYFKDLKPDIVVVHNSEAAHGIEQMARSNETTGRLLLKVILDAGPSPSTLNGWFSMSSIATIGLQTPVIEEELLEAARHDDPDRLCSIIFTSGTSSGNPKGCPRHVSGIAYVTQIQRFDRGITEATVYLHYTANFRAIAPALCFSTWSIGGTIVMQDPTADTKGTIAAIREHGVNMLILIPALLHALIADPEFAQLDVSGVKQTLAGGDMVTRDIFSKMQQAFPQANHFVGHGMSEGGAIVEWPWRGKSLESDIPFFGEICPLGHVSPGTNLRIRDPTTGQTVRRNELGELCILNPGTIKEYLNNSHPEAFFYDGSNKWFRTGDLGMINDNDIVYIVGRLKDIIKRAGIPITPAALESCIQKFTASQVAVIAYPHPTLGQEPLVVLDSLNGKTVEDIKEHVLSMFSKDYALGPVLTIEELGLTAFPLNATGKIMKFDLLESAKDYFRKQEGAA